MTDLSITHFKAIIWKEFKEILRSSSMFIIIAIMSSVVMQCLVARKLLVDNNLPLEIKKIMLGQLLIYLSLLSIPYFANMLLSRVIFEERFESAIHFMLAIGIDKRNIWLAKILTISIISYLVFLLSAIVYYAVIGFGYGIWMVIGIDILIMAFLASPMIAIGSISLMGFIYWSMKNPQLLSLFLPMLIVMGVWGVAMKWVAVAPTSLMFILSFSIGALLFIIPFWAVRFISNERITNI